MLNNFITNLNTTYNKGRMKKKPWRLRNSSGKKKPYKMPKKRKKSSLFFIFFTENLFKKQKTPTRLNLTMKKNLIFHYYLRNFLYPQYKATAWKQFINQKLKGDSKNSIAKFLWLLNSRVDHLLLKLHFRYTLNNVLRIIRGGWILVNGEIVTKPSYNVAIGSLISFSYAGYLVSIAQRSFYKGNIKEAFSKKEKPLVSKKIFRRLGLFVRNAKHQMLLLHKKKRHFIQMKRFRKIFSFMQRLRNRKKRRLLIWDDNQRVLKDTYIGTKWSKFFATSLKNKDSSNFFKPLVKSNKWESKEVLNKVSKGTPKAFHLKVSKAYFICRQIKKAPLTVKNFRTNLRKINNTSLSNFIEFNPKIFTYLIFRNIYTKLKNIKITPLNIKATILKKIYDNRYTL